MGISFAYVPIKASLVISLAYLPITAANSWFIDGSDQAPFGLPKM